jgi:NTP pyrophosphatase (non-canonical NTP hydrolase)
MQTKISERLVDELAAERVRQDSKWGEQNHAPAFYLMILGEEVGEANKAALEAYFLHDPARLEDYRKELVQVAAVAVAMIECLDRNKFPGELAAVKVG